MLEEYPIPEPFSGPIDTSEGATTKKSCSLVLDLAVPTGCLQNDRNTLLHAMRMPFYIIEATVADSLLRDYQHDGRKIGYKTNPHMSIPVLNTMDASPVTAPAISRGFRSPSPMVLRNAGSYAISSFVPRSS